MRTRRPPDHRLALSPLRVCLIALLLFRLSLGAEAAADDRLLRPSSAPRAIRPANLLTARVVLRLPLTPPPGVQQAKAFGDWSGTLVRRDVLRLPGASREVSYVIPLAAMHPESQRVYRVELAIPAWIPSGLYSLRLTGPGFIDELGSYAVVGADTRARHSGVVTPRPGRDDIFDLEPAASAPSASVLDLIVPQGAGLTTLFIDGAAYTPHYVTFAHIPEPGCRGDLLYSYDLDGARLERREVEIRYSKTPSAPVGAPRIRFSREPHRQTVRPLVWHDLSASWPGRAPSWAVWRFGENRWGSGLETRHRWLTERRARVEVCLLEPSGAVGHAAFDRPLWVDSGRGCRCEIAGRDATIRAGILAALAAHW